MTERHLFTAVSDSGWRTSVSITGGNMIEMNAGSGRIVLLSIKDIRKIVREYNKATKVKP